MLRLDRLGFKYMLCKKIIDRCLKKNELRKLTATSLYNIFMQYHLEFLNSFYVKKFPIP